MTRILFICLGNICRSPMAESIMKDLVSKAGLSEQFEIASAAQEDRPDFRFPMHWWRLMRFQIARKDLPWTQDLS